MFQLYGQIYIYLSILFLFSKVVDDSVFLSFNLRFNGYELMEHVFPNIDAPFSDNYVLFVMTIEITW